MKFDGKDYAYINSSKYKGYVINYYKTETSSMYHIIAEIPSANNYRVSAPNIDEAKEFAEKQIDIILNLRNF